MSKVSVIIPVYNVEQYLSRCLDSVINQTYENLEIVCVNDCSLDNSAQILNSYAKKDNRIKIVNRNKNGGLSAARNSGLEVATSEYIYFLDSDDWIDENYIEELVLNLEKTNCDIVLNNNFIKEYENKSEQFIWQRYPKQLPQGEFVDKINAINKTPCMIWCHLYKKSFLDKFNLRFPEDYIHEDEYFQHISKYNADKIFVFFGSSYHYTQREDSIMETRKSKVSLYINISNLIFDFYKKHNYNGIKIILPDIVYNTKLDNFMENKNYFNSVIEYYNKNRSLYSDYDRFLIDNLISSNTFDEYTKKNGFNPYITYFTRNKIQKQKNIKVSVIIPVYNVEKYLARCIDSVIYQTLEDIEIICINDCSPDNSIEILKEYAENDNRIKIIDFKENKGVARARNEGMKIAKGEYIGFVDSDDWIDLDFFEKLYNEAVCNKANIAVADLKTVCNNKISNRVNYSDKINDNKIHFNGFFFLGIYDSKIVKEHFEEIKFSENLKYGEDRIFPIGACYYSNKVIALNNVFYYYCTREQSASREYYYDKEKLMDFFSSTKTILQYFNKLNYSAYDYFVFFNEYIEYVLKTMMLSDKYKSIVADIFKYCFENVKFPNDENILKHEKLYVDLKNNNYSSVQKYFEEQRKKEIFSNLRKNLDFNKAGSLR